MSKVCMIFLSGINNYSISLIFGLFLIMAIIPYMLIRYFMERFLNKTKDRYRIRASAFRYFVYQTGLVISALLLAYLSLMLFYAMTSEGVPD